MNDITLIACCYNTPDLVVKMLKSLLVTSKTLPELCIINTSNDQNTSQILMENNIPFYNFRGGIHGEAVNLALSKVKTKYAILVDSDIIFLKDFTEAFETFKKHKLSAMGKIVGDVGGKKLYPRIEPWFCFIDMMHIKYNKILFFDRERTKESKKTDRVYDIGSTMYEDLLKCESKIGNVDIENKFFKHYGGMSWRVQKYNPSYEDTDIDFGGTHPNKAIWESGIMIKNIYYKETQHLNSISLNKNTFI